METTTTIERVDTVFLMKERSGIVLNLDTMVIHFSKPYMMEYIASNIDTIKNYIDSSKHNTDYSIKKLNFLLKELTERDTIQIANIPYIDSLSLENMGFQERMKTIDRSDELKFGLYFLDVYCELLESGQLSILIGDNFMDTLYKNRYSISDQISGSSGFSFTTTKGEEIFRCRPYFRYN